MPDRFIEHGDYRDQLNLAGLTPGHIAGTALQLVCSTPGQDVCGDVHWARGILGRKADAAKYAISNTGLVAA
eukprot:1152316-Pelagomonas_calceolata.AAC.2